jgi:hypothetical protein
VTATFAIPAGSALGAHLITVSTPNLTSNNVTFTVVGPTLTNIAPSSGRRGTNNLAVTITGTGLATATGVTIGGTGSGVTCALAAPAPTDATVHATCNITSGAGINQPRAVTVATGIGSAAGVTFTVTGATATEAVTTGSFTTSTANRNPKAATITVTNNGTGPTTLSAAPTIFRVSGTGTWTVVVGGTCANGVTLAAGGGSCTVNAAYAPPLSLSTCAAVNNCTSTAHIVLTGTGFAAPTQAATPDITGN